MTTTETLNWTPNMLGCQAEAPIGTFFINPAREKSAAGVTQFILTLMAPVGHRGYRGEMHQTLGIFEAPPLAKLMAEAVAKDAT